jgi:hypothetical protein
MESNILFSRLREPAAGSAYRSGSDLKDGAVVARNSQPQWQPTKLGRRGPRGSWDPFYQFEQIARDHGEPTKPPKPAKTELLLVGLLSSKTAAVVMACVLGAVLLGVLILLVLRG